MAPSSLRPQASYGIALRARQAAATLAGWWLAELFALLPRRLQEALRGRSRRLVVDLEDDKPRLRLFELDTFRELADLAGLADSRLRVGAVVVRVPAARSLRRSLTLPLAAERNLGAVLGFEMDRYTPYKADAVYFHFAVARRDAHRRCLQVALAVVPRAACDPVLEHLRSAGLEPTSLEIQGADPAFNLLPAARAPLRRRIAWQARLLPLLAVLLFAGVLAVPFARKLQTVSALEIELAQIRSEARAGEQMRQDLERLVQEDRALIERRARRPDAIQILQALTRLIPDGTWLNHLELNGARVRIRGESPNAAELVPLLENSGTFKGASFDGSVTRDPNSEGERFVISASAVQAARP